MVTNATITLGGTVHFRLIYLSIRGKRVVLQYSNGALGQQKPAVLSLDKKLVNSAYRDEKLIYRINE